MNWKVWASLYPLSRKNERLSFGWWLSTNDCEKVQRIRGSGYVVETKEIIVPATLCFAKPEECFLVNVSHGRPKVVQLLAIQLAPKDDIRVLLDNGCQQPISNL